MRVGVLLHLRVRVRLPLLVQCTAECATAAAAARCASSASSAECGGHA